MGKWGDSAKHEAPNLEAAARAKLELSIILSGLPLLLIAVDALVLLFASLVDDRVMIFVAIVAYLLPLALILSLVGLITAKGRARWYARWLTAASVIAVFGLLFVAAA